MNAIITRLVFLGLFLTKLTCYSQTTYYSNAVDPLEFESTWGTATDGSGTPPPNFTSGDRFVICNRTVTDISTTGIWNLSTTATIQIGDNTNPINFVITTGESIANAKVEIASNATLTVNDVSPLNVFSNPSPFISIAVRTATQAGSAVVYSVSGSVVYPTNYGSLIINDNAVLGGAAVVAGTLEIASTKTLDLAGNFLTVNGGGVISGTGSLSAATSTLLLASSGLVSGNTGTLNFTGTPPAIKDLRVSFTNSANVISLGSDLSVTGSGGQFLLSFGQFDLNGHALTLDNAITLPTSASGNFRGSANSRILVGGSGTITNPNNLRLNSSASSLKALVLNRSGAALTIATNTINIIDSLSVLSGTLNTAGLLTLKASAGMTGRVGRISGTINGNITQETFIPGSTTGWANLGVSGVSGQTVANWDTYASSAGTNGIPMTCTGCVYSQSVLPNWFTSIAGWSEINSDYDTTITASTSLTAGRGFWVFVGDGLTVTNDLKLINTGPIVQGNYSVALTASGSGTNQGYNLVANPYPSPVSWTKILAASGGTASGLADAIYVWNADLGVTTSFANGLASHGTGGINDVIPTGQGFYVQTTSLTSLVFDESVKTNSNTGTNPLLKPSSSSGSQVFRLRLQGPYDWDESAFRFHSDATAAYDNNWDAHKIFQSPGYAGYPGPYTKYTTISSKDAANEDYSINSLPPLTTSLAIPVLAKVSNTGTYTISARDFMNFNNCIDIHDKLNNTYHDLRISDYIFTMNDTTSTPRFELILCKEGDVQTSVPEVLAAAANSQVLIQQDGQGAFVKTNFEKPTKATISVCNIIGQKLMDDIVTTGTTNTTYLPLNCANQVVFVTVTTDSGRNTKKIVVH